MQVEKCCRNSVERSQRKSKIRQLEEQLARMEDQSSTSEAKHQAKIRDLILINEDMVLKIEHLKVQSSEQQREIIRLTEFNKELRLKNEILQECLSSQKQSKLYRKPEGEPEQQTECGFSDAGKLQKVSLMLDQTPIILLSQPAYTVSRRGLKAEHSRVG